MSRMYEYLYDRNQQLERELSIVNANLAAARAEIDRLRPGETHSAVCIRDRDGRFLRLGPWPAYFATGFTNAVIDFGDDSPVAVAKKYGGIVHRITATIEPLETPDA
jgi:hypothetical protein